MSTVTFVTSQSQPQGKTDESETKPRKPTVLKVESVSSQPPPDTPLKEMTPPPGTFGERPPWMPEKITDFKDIGKRLLDHAPDNIKNGSSLEKAKFLFGQLTNLGQ